jgi:uncharacterized protein YndB with AHSA1/START domain
MPSQKDLKKIIRARMEKTGESYTAARLNVVSRKSASRNAEPRNAEPPRDYAKLAGMSDSAVKKATGRGWSDWLAVLDEAHCNEKPHREIAVYVKSLGTPDWWSQMVTVGYERIRGLRDMAQRRGGAYEASKSRTFNVPVEMLFDAIANARKRSRWLDVKFTVRTANANKTVRGSMDGSPVQFYFVDKGKGKSSVAVTQEKLADKEAVAVVKESWGTRFDRLAEMLK